MWDLLVPEGTDINEQLAEYQKMGVSYSPPIKTWVERHVAGKTLMFRSRLGDPNLESELFYIHSIVHLLTSSVNKKMSESKLRLLECLHEQSADPELWQQLREDITNRELLMSTLLDFQIFLPSELLETLNIEVSSVVARTPTQRWLWRPARRVVALPPLCAPVWWYHLV
jgi:hypothetical protein